MSTKYYANEAGDFIGCFVDGAKPPKDAVEVPTAPNAASDKWSADGWAEDPAVKAAKDAADTTKAKVKSAVEQKLGVSIDELKAALGLA